jgi:hypothetical protein
MNEDKRREIAQLWAVAERYYPLATDAKSHLDPTELKMTVGEFADKCRDQSYLDKHTSLLYAVAHLTSGAIRLYSIEQRLNSKRWVKYKEINNSSNNEEKIKKELEDNIDSLIHFLLRHEVAHAEPETNKGYIAMYNFYRTLSYESVFQAMAAARQSIKNELETKGFLPKA